ncbi:hypothetical protein GLOIN_2v1669421 [Rhizophagus irregularis DAOM 181602=DAOM 197198]|uniref:Uncharacterized protein n=1 Tax=Rhizophagus irregularis (strain DAOM 181602 / DAOM 197198 / MUCL 43194) TaxID=747089 RepID=A0A2P4PIA3_RHIID|nr:hypothetical protein GLOIN_2v1669421 [Rhizophagus irregularis DAOM 181602=DAOM 197198]POG65113.1 hypothetical protein GLOIN_2v1669421 [Rhizophagus irregularis DAOM 181602=DAOM 197198]|eukprot:XP_025171979.1 hypothetical protein GLOIN_2v1669421 [Rhizophagus irregularis DAOM 181602=DAOM 197198]
MSKMSFLCETFCNIIINLHSLLFFTVSSLQYISFTVSSFTVFFFYSIFFYGIFLL